MSLINPTHLEKIPALPKGGKDPGLVHAIIETPRDTRHKFAFDPEFGAFILKQLLPDGLQWPYDYGFIPQTLADDGDPLDVLNLTEVQTFTGCVTKCRVLGIVRMKKDGVQNDRIVAAPTSNEGVWQPTDAWTDVDDIPPATVEGIIRFLVEYSAEQGHDIKCKGIKPRKTALDAIGDAMRAFKRARKDVA